MRLLTLGRDPRYELSYPAHVVERALTLEVIALPEILRPDLGESLILTPGLSNDIPEKGGFLDSDD